MIQSIGAEITHICQSALDKSVQELLIRNNEAKHRFNNNLLFRAMRDGILSDSEARDRFLAYFQTWSSNFQKTVLLRTAFCEDPRFSKLALQHFYEELGHDEKLKSDRHFAPVRKDVILNALTAWFPFKMMSLNQYEQILVMHLVIEGSAIIFYKNARPVIDPKREMVHFEAHAEGVDTSHELFGIELLNGLSDLQYERLFDLQEEAWAHLEAIMTRIAELSIPQ